MSALARAFSALWLTGAIILSGAAAAETAQPPPTDARPIAVIYSDKGPSGWSDLPAGAYRVPDTSVIISGHQKGGVLGVMFGALGVLAQSAANSEAGKGSVSDTQDVLRIDVVGDASEITHEALRSEKYSSTFTSAADTGGPTLSVTPYVAITFESDTQVRPFIVLKATLKSGRSGDASRSTRYFCCVGQPLPLTGEGSVTANGGQLLKDLLKHELERAVRVMLDDTANPYPRDEHKLINVEANYPFVRPRMKLRGYELWEDDNTVVVALKASSLVVFSGVQIMDKSAITYEQAAGGK